MISDPLFILGALCFFVVVSDYLVRRSVLNFLGTALLVIVVTAIAVNTGILSSPSKSSQPYEAIFTYIAPISIFYLLLQVNLRHLKQAGIPMLLVFLLGSVGTVTGVVISLWLIGGESAFEDLQSIIAGLFTATYTGGSINFNAIALHYNFNQTGNLYAGVIAVDAIMTTVWMVATLLIPKLLYQVLSKTGISKVKTESHDVHTEIENLTAKQLGVILSLGIFALYFANSMAALIAEMGMHIPSILILTSLALVLAQFPTVVPVQGSKVLGMFSVNLFLAVVGAYCDLDSLYDIGGLGVTLFIFVTLLILIHGLIVFGLGMIVCRDWDVIAVASQANIGGSTTALALAKSLNRTDLILPAVLVGSLGNAIGTYLGFMTIWML